MKQRDTRTSSKTAALMPAMTLLSPSSPAPTGAVAAPSTGPRRCSRSHTSVKSGLGTGNYRCSRPRSSKTRWIGCVIAWVLARRISSIAMVIRSCWRERGSWGMRQKRCRRIRGDTNIRVGAVGWGVERQRSRGRMCVGCLMRRGRGRSLWKGIRLSESCSRREAGIRPRWVSRAYGRRMAWRERLSSRRNALLSPLDP